MIAAESSLVVGVLARDCEASLEKNIKRLEELCSCFKSYRIVVYENDSKDRTKDILRSWCERNENVEAIMEDTQTKTIPKKTITVPYPNKSVYRIEKMAKFRNRILDEVRRKYTPDLFCFIDIDITAFDAASVVKAIEQAPEDWGGLFANGAIYMQYSDHVQPDYMQYDSYAYVDNGVDPLKAKDWQINKYFDFITSCCMTWKLRKTKYLSCYSAFNGLGVYRWDVVKNQSYSILQTPELKSLQACLCEHVGFNMSIVQKGYKNYIAREMKVVYWYEQPREKTGMGRWQNYYRAFYYFQGRPKRLSMVLKHIIKERLGLFPYQRIEK